MIYIKRDGFFNVNDDPVFPEDLPSLIYSPIKSVESLPLIEILSYLWNGLDLEKSYSMFFKYNPTRLYDLLMDIEAAEESNGGFFEQEFERIEIYLNSDLIIKDKEPAKSFSITEVSGVKENEYYAIDNISLESMLHTPVVIRPTSDMHLSWPQSFKTINLKVETNIDVFNFYKSLIREITAFNNYETSVKEERELFEAPKGE